MNSFWEWIYSWPGYDFWSIVLSVFGFAASVYFARSASGRAQIAAEAAKEAKFSVRIADVSSQLGTLQQLLVEIRLRVENQSWLLVSERCGAARLIIAPLIQSENLLLSENIAKSLLGLQSQITALQKKAEETLHKDSAFDHVKVNLLLARQAEALAAAIQEIKDQTDVINTRA